MHESAHLRSQQALLDQVSIVRHLPGRLRFHLNFGGDEILADALRRSLHRLESVRMAAYSERTRTVLVTYDPHKAAPTEIATALLTGVMAFYDMHGDCEVGPHHNHQTRGKDHHHHEEDDHGHDHSAYGTDANIRKELFKLTATGVALAYFVFKRFSGNGSPAAAAALAPLRALLTIATGYPIFRAGIAAVQQKGKATDDTLITVAVLATLVLGESLTGLSVVWLINLGKLLEAITLKRSRTAIKELMDIVPDEAWVIDPASQRVGSTKTPVAKLRKGQILRVFAGEKVALDGIIHRGEGLLKEAFLTGEALPRRKTLGHEVYAGSLVEAGEIDIKVRNLFNETIVAQMIDAIENIRDHKAPIEKVGDRFASRFVPIAIGIAGVTWLVTGDVGRAITMLVIACPCAAGLATPTAVSAAIGQAARRGILIKGGTHVEAAAHISALVFDKTGTLTEGMPTVQAFIMTRAGADLGEESCLQLAASAEQHSLHPLGVSLLKAAKARQLELLPVESFAAEPGFGLTSTLVNGDELRLGSAAFMDKLGVPMPPETAATIAKEHAGDTMVFAARNGRLLGAFAIQDSLRKEAQATLAAVRRLGVERIILATGDQPGPAAYVADKLGLREVRSQMLPHDKLALIQELQAAGHRVAMVGDGVNDAQALTKANLSIAMGAGRCDVVIETADVTLARDDLQLVAEVLEISQKTLRTIHQNLFFSIGINALGVGYGAVGKLSPFFGAIVHNASTIAVVINSFRLGRNVAQASR